MSRTAFVPTDEQRNAVSIMAACGTPHRIICKKIINHQTSLPIDEKTLRKAFRQELDEGLIATNAMVKQSLIKTAMSTRNNSVQAATAWLGAHGGPEWRKKVDLDLSNKDDKPFKVELTEARFAAIAKGTVEDV
ncbi:MAG: hypothetical protein JO253_06365 [Alphaproteobacteria bacterium]|nr:hypothetical protein [Alphaproteobacteria bacterium]